ncbi:MAG TPA: RagB/SusD family nutrient uptake outer membrane protein [Dinghuibacter sp.]|uniref:RagB/SusD family nutrient uptake outer membrane protein n=1 Tax=Dinghuibacter sp. TaxID=2024697 RepID=UPI002B967842|nr:RagB/SusD family nutrient uptake outer membrane protein [Dinghuibacter sp.]HTJ10391.1 RagB/SusD family nutrient uptake outer membrane protein [Dinghuibacter sp.]
MKKIFVLVPLCCWLCACKKSFLDVQPQGGAVTINLFYNASGVQQLLVGAYHDLTGIDVKSTWWGTSGTNWVYGDLPGGDAYLGGTPGSGYPHQVPDALNIENFQSLPTTGFIDDKWTADYDGVARANSVIIAATNATDMTDAQRAEAIGEARFLRGHFHFDAKMMWKNIPFVDETVANFNTLPNSSDIWPLIEADFRYAFDNCNETQPLVGQANKWAAACYLAKCYMFEQKFAQAKGLLDSIISSGKNAQGVPYALTPCYHDNFDVTRENNSESVLQTNFSVDYTSLPDNANLGETGVSPVGTAADVTYGYWKQPSFNLVNAFKTDASGLPMLDASGNDTSNGTNMKNDMGVPSSSPFVPYQGTVDPRLDWTVGRRGVPYLDWGVDPGQDWVADQAFGGPFVNIKNMFSQANEDVGFGGIISAYYYVGNSAVNYNIIRYAEVLLWAAEAEVEVGSLEQARAYVNMVRSRAMNGCKVAIDNATGYPSANYSMSLYASPWTDQTYARAAVRFETRLELGMEGHRFFNLVRWGLASTFMNDYISVEENRGVGSVVNGSHFTQGKNEYFPIPQQEITLDPKLTQNPGY